VWLRHHFVADVRKRLDLAHCALEVWRALNSCLRLTWRVEWFAKIDAFCLYEILPGRPQQFVTDSKDLLQIGPHGLDPLTLAADLIWRGTRPQAGVVLHLAV